MGNGGFNSFMACFFPLPPSFPSPFAGGIVVSLQELENIKKGDRTNGGEIPLALLLNSNKMSSGNNEVFSLWERKLILANKFLGFGRPYTEKQDPWCWNYCI